MKDYLCIYLWTICVSIEKLEKDEGLPHARRLRPGRAVAMFVFVVHGKSNLGSNIPMTDPSLSYGSSVSGSNGTIVSLLPFSPPSVSVQV